MWDTGVLSARHRSTKLGEENCDGSETRHNVKEQECKLTFPTGRASIPGCGCRSGVGACGPEVLMLISSDFHNSYCFPVIRKADLGRVLCNSHVSGQCSKCWCEQLTRGKRQN